MCNGVMGWCVMQRADSATCELSFRSKPNQHVIYDNLKESMWSGLSDTFRLLSRYRASAWYHQYPDSETSVHVQCTTLQYSAQYTVRILICEREGEG